MILREFSSLEEHSENIVSFALAPYNCFVLMRLIAGREEYVDCDCIDEIKTKANMVPWPKVYTIKEGWALLDLPLIRGYIEFLDLVGAKQQRMTLHSVPFSRLYELLRFVRVWRHPVLPRPIIEDSLKEYMRNFKSKTISSLFKIPLGDLVSIKHGYRINPKGFERLDMQTAADILLHRPIKYEDRSILRSLENPTYISEGFYKVTVEKASQIDSRRILLEFSQGNIEGKAYIYGTYWKNILKPETEIIIAGIPSRNNIFYQARLLKTWEVEALPVSPIYKQSPSNGLKTKVLINCVQELLERCSLADMSTYMLDKELGIQGFYNHNLEDIISNLHFPANSEVYLETIRELSFLELVYMQVLFLNKKEISGFQKGHKKSSTYGVIPKLAIDSLPFSLTEAQEAAIEELLELFGTEEAKRAIVSGDVGSGKTIVAQIMALQSTEEGLQVAIVGPTEVLAQQLYKTTVELVNKINAKLEKPISVGFLSGSVEGIEAKHVKEEVAKGRIDIVVGTHSLFNLDYKNLGLVVIDEQHKFGANQRDSLLRPDKNGRIPDLISQTATPIPRSTALAFYGDTHLVQIKGKPQGRLPVDTKWVKEDPAGFIKGNTLYSEAIDSWKLVEDEIEKGNQIFVVCSAVTDSGKTGQVSVEEATKILTKRFKKNSAVSVSSIHGQMSKDKQNSIIEKFRKKESNILVASSIIEVGVDIPDATVIVVLDAHRFGAAQLHQIRGRVGRNSMQSYCILVAPFAEASKDRLESLVDSNDGFKIALIDLKTRNQGDIFGERQSGESSLRFVDIIDHSDLVETAKVTAEKLFGGPLRDQVVADAKAFLRVD